MELRRLALTLMRLNVEVSKKAGVCPQETETTDEREGIRSVSKTKPLTIKI